MGITSGIGQTARVLSKDTEKVVGYFNPINKGPLPDAVANSFRSATYSQKVLGEDKILYRAYGGKAKEIGQYWTRTKPEGPLQTVIDSALDQNWGNSAIEVAKIRIPKGTTIYEGFAEKQGASSGAVIKYVFTLKGLIRHG